MNARPPVDPELDRLELELRRVPGVSYVGFTRRDDAFIVTLGCDGASLALAREAVHRAAHRLPQPVTVRKLGETRAPRVRLVTVEAEYDTASDAGAAGAAGAGGGAGAGGADSTRYQGGDSTRYKVALEYRGEQAIAVATSEHPEAVAAATVAALGGLGARVPYWVDGTARFQHPVGDGVAVVLRSLDIGAYRLGIAAGARLCEAAARATLQALNRDLVDSIESAAPDAPAPPSDDRPSAG